MGDRERDREWDRWSDGWSSSDNLLRIRQGPPDRVTEDDDDRGEWLGVLILSTVAVIFLVIGILIGWYMR